MELFPLMGGECHAHPVVISIPHSGTWIPDDIRNALRHDAILASTDWYLPDLYDFLAAQGYTVLMSNVSRYVADVNRSPGKRHLRDARGVAVYTETSFGKPLYDEPLAPDEIARRIALYHAPYHAALQNALDEKIRRFGRVLLIDLHSFGRDIAPDLVLGTARGTTVSAGLSAALCKAMNDEGFRVAVDAPFAGGYITHRYGSRNGPVEAVQIELSYAAYIGRHALGEVSAPEPDAALFAGAQARLARVFAALAEKIK